MATTRDVLALGFDQDMDNPSMYVFRWNNTFVLLPIKCVPAYTIDAIRKRLYWILTKWDHNDGEARQFNLAAGPFKISEKTAVDAPDEWPPNLADELRQILSQE